MKVEIKWVSIYSPIGEWQLENGDRVSIDGGFKCRSGSADLIVVMTNSTSHHGHGEPSIIAQTPMFIDAHTLKLVNVEGLVTVDGATLRKV